MDFPSKIKTERLILKKPENSTFKLAQEMYLSAKKSREHLAPFLPWAKTLSSAEQEFVCLKEYEENWKQQKSFAYLIYSKEENLFLGVIDLIHVDIKNKSAEIGFWLDKDACGKGYMREAVKALEKEAFRQGFHRIVISNDPNNIKSINVAKNLGYHLDGVLRQNRFDEETGEFYDSNIFSKLISD